MKREYPVKRTENRVVFPCRLSYVHLSEPWSNSDTDEKKYSVCCLYGEGDTRITSEIDAAIEDAKKKGIASKWGGKLPKNVKSVIHSGNAEREEEEYKDQLYFNANSKKPVPVLNKLKEDIDPEQAYSGCYALVSITFFPYDSNGSRGIAAGLNSVLKLEEGERLGGNGDGRKDFDGLDLGVDDDLDL